MTGIPEDLIAAEQVVVGAAISSRENADAVAEVLEPGHLLRPAHQVMLEAALRLAADGQPVGPVAVLTELVRSGDVRALSSPDYVHDVFAAGVPGWMFHARRVREEHDRRAYVAILQTALGEASEPGFSFGGATEVLRERLDKVAVPKDGALRSMRDLVQDAVEELENEKPRGLASPWEDLSLALCGITPGQVIIVGARPSVGKSVVGAQWAGWVAMKLGVPSLLVSAEMTADELTMRLISAAARVPLHALLSRELGEGDWDRIARRTEALKDSPLVIDDSARPSLAKIRSRLRAERPGLLVVDYLQLLEPPDGSENRQNAVAALSRGLKSIAREFRIPVIVLAQLNRGLEQRQDRRPTMADLRESGQIEADADVILLLHREDMHERESPRAGEIDVIVEKNRQGPRCTVTLAFQGHYARVVDMAPLQPADERPAQGPDWTPASVLERRPA
jgi:replicative DNA helicase